MVLKRSMVKTLEKYGRKKTSLKKYGKHNKKDTKKPGVPKVVDTSGSSILLYTL